MTDLEKKMNKRWGEKPQDNRNWPEYNRQLVRRGKYWLDLDWVKTWEAELDEMNLNKLGHPYEYPTSLIVMQGVWHTHNIPYRMIQGITIQLYHMAKLPKYNHYSTACRRVNCLDISLGVPSSKNLALFSDGSGFQAIEGGEYLREKYGKKNRRWVQVIILADPVTKEPVSFEVNVVPRSEADSAQHQMDNLIDHGVDIDSFGGDGGFDSLKLWKFLEQNRIRPIIKPQKNARTDTTSSWRNINARFLNENGYQAWASKLKYGLRWPATEGIFSAIKRMYNEQLRAKSEKGLIQEAKMKVWTYKTIKNYGEA